MPIWQLCANLLIPNCLRSNLSYFPLAALELYVKKPAPLKKVVKELEEVYKVHIGGIPQKEYYLTTTFDNTPIEDIIEIINQTLDTKLDITQ